jgi:hypothetical protein
MHTGKSTRVLEDYSKLNYIEDNWFMGIKKFMNKFNSHLEIKSIWKSTIYRKNDKNLMDTVDALSITKTKKQVFNNWRLYFNVINLSDIANAVGDTIIKEVLIKKEVANYIHRSTYRWPKQDRPHMSTFSIWKSILRYVFGVSSSGTLQQKLGEWKQHPVEKIKFQYIANPSKTKILSRILNNDDQWLEHTYQKYARGKIHYAKHGQIVPTPIDINEYIPVDVVISNTSININSRTCRYFAPRLQNITNNNTTRSLKSFLINEQKDSPGSIKLLESNEHLLSTTNIREITICTDGGLRQNKGGFGVILSINKNIAIKGVKRVKEKFNYMTSYRTEALGILAGLYLYKRMQKYLQVKDIAMDYNEITLICDNESVITNINKIKKYKMNQKIMYTADADVFLEIQQCLKDIDKQVIFKHVKGHQDKQSLPLTYLAFMNCEADNLATRSLETRQVPTYETSSYKATLFIEKLPIFSEHNKNIKETYHAIRYKKHLSDSYGWNEHIINKIWWEPLDKALNRLPEGNKTSLHKFIHKRLPCNRRENIYYPYLSDSCKLCSDITECQFHVIRCQNCAIRIEAREKFIKNLKYKLEQDRTGTTTTNVLVYYIQSWLKNEPLVELRNIAPEASSTLYQAVLDQHRLGWDQIFCGRMSIEWKNAYEEDLKNVNIGGSKSTSTKWGTSIVLMAYDLFLQCWNIRNELEYDKEDEESETSSKKKLIRKIIWNIERIGDQMENPYSRMTSEALQVMPMANLEMIDDQLINMNKRIKRRNESNEYECCT